MVWKDTFKFLDVLHCKIGDAYIAEETQEGDFEEKKD
jgi:hypothetical protein